MENFSDFFDSVVSGKEKATNSATIEAPEHTINNDNNIYNNTNINNSEQQIFPIEDYYLLSNEIIIGAARQYYSLYESLTIPYAFIAFYFKQFEQVSENPSYYLKKYLLLFENKKNNIANIITIFTKTYSSQSEIKYIKKTSIFNDLKQGYYLKLDNDLAEKIIVYKSDIDSNLNQAILEVRENINRIADSAIEKNLKYNYIDFLSKSNETESSIPTITEISFDDEPTQENLTAARKKKLIAPPKQEKAEKVSSISLPKLKLTKPYITSYTHSRIDSSKFAFKFMEPHSAYELIKKYKFKIATFTDGFETKRTKLFEVKKSTFDLF